jgi:2-C-methyl-D-erythritol 4-phosphate cytidylyltransferase
MGAAIEDKILALLGGKPVLWHSVEAFQQSACVRQICIVYRDSAQLERLKTALTSPSRPDLSILWTRGGNTRQESVANGLNALPRGSGFTFIHDAARPLVTPADLSKLAAVAERDGAACLAHRLIDTIKRVEAPEKICRVALEDLERNRLWAMETPQVFRTEVIRKAYRQVMARKLNVTDDAAAAATIGIPLTLVPNEKPNPKITTEADLSYLEWLLAS